MQRRLLHGVVDELLHTVFGKEVFQTPVYRVSLIQQHHFLE